MAPAGKRSSGSASEMLRNQYPRRFHGRGQGNRGSNFTGRRWRPGGQDNGPPGLRPHYHENYYGAFILDPDGHNIEAVCHRKQRSQARASA